MNQFQATGNKLEIGMDLYQMPRHSKVGVYRDADIQSLFLSCRKKCNTGHHTG